MTDPDVLDDESDDTPGEQLDDGSDEGHTITVSADDSLVEAPAPAVLDSGPDPITPASSPQEYRDRVAYENWLNSEIEATVERLRADIHEKLSAGATNLRLDADYPDDYEPPSGDEVASTVAPETALAAAADAGLTPYSEWTNAELSDECRNRDLAVSGTKDELIAWLEADDAADAAADS